MHVISREDYEHLHETGEVPEAIGEEESGQDAYRLWEAQMQSYNAGSYDLNSPVISLWLALALPHDNYADQIEFHSSLPMLVPVAGAPIKVLGIFPDKKSVERAMEEDEGRVHLLYKLRIHGGVSICRFLEYAASHGMMEKAD